MSDIQITAIPAYTDNYIWCLADGQHCVVVDPGDAAPVLEAIGRHGYTLSAILITHHHWDHTNGIDALLSAYPGIPVFGPHNPAISQITHHLGAGDSIDVPGIDVSLSVFEVPGHTLDHIAYLGNGWLFCGDTLFSGGCGRLFEGTPEQMWASLRQLSELPDNTKVYCTHEYTQANLAFAQAVDPHNQQLNEYSRQVDNKRNQLQPTLPSTIGQEKAINPFLRVSDARIIQHVEEHVGETLNNDAAVFGALRRWKDQF